MQFVQEICSVQETRVESLVYLHTNGAPPPPPKKNKHDISLQFTKSHVHNFCILRTIWRKGASGYLGYFLLDFRCPN